MVADARIPIWGITALCLVATVAASQELGIGDELFMAPGIDGGLMVENDRYRAASLLEGTTWPPDIALAQHGGADLRLEWPDGLPEAPDRLHLLDGAVCGRDVIEVVARIPPPQLADFSVFDYYRFIVDVERHEVMASFFDESVAAVNGIVPIASVAGEDARWPVYSLTCKDDGAVVVR